MADTLFPVFMRVPASRRRYEWPRTAIRLTPIPSVHAGFRDAMNPSGPGRSRTSGSGGLAECPGTDGADEPVEPYPDDLKGVTICDPS
jgi:hypothetical protein